MTWVVIDLATMPRPEGLEPFSNPEGQFLYAANFKDHVPHWWSGVLQQWEVTKLTDSITRGVLLDLSLPLVPRLRQPRNDIIPADPSDLDDDDDESQPDIGAAFNSMD